MRLKIIILYLLLTAAPSHAASRLFCRSRDFAPSTGLTQCHIANALTDSLGFVWFATWNGLVRYDGYNFYTFKPSAYSNGSIVTNRIFNLKLNTRNDIWCVSADNRLHHFDTRLCLFTDMAAIVPDIARREVSRLFTTDKGITWISFKDGACLRLTDNDIHRGWTFYAPGKILPKGGKMNKVKTCANGEEWLLGNKEAVEHTRGTRIKGDFRFAYEAGGRTWLVTSDGNVCETTGGRVTARLDLWEGKNHVGNVTSRHGYSAIATDQGLAVLRTKGKLGLYLMPIKGRKVKDAHFDSQGRLWAFTEDSRITLVIPSSKTVSELQTATSPNKTKPTNPQVLFENGYGSVIMKPYTGVLSVYDDQSGTLVPITTPGTEGGEVMPDMEIKRFLSDHQGNLWIFQKERTTHISFTRELFRHNVSQSGKEVRAMLCDAYGRQWITDRSGAVYVSKDGKPLHYIQPGGTLTPSHALLTAEPPYCMTEDGRHRIWIGTKGDGLYLLTPRGATHTEYDVQHFSRTSRDHRLPCDSVYAITADQRGNVWVGTYGKGLYRASDRGGTIAFTSLPLRDEYSKIRCVKAHASNVLLIGTTGGLATVDITKAQPTPHYNTYRTEEWGLKATDVMQIVTLGGKVYLCMFGEGISEVTSQDLLTDSIHFRNDPIPTSSAADQVMSAAADGQSIWIVSEEAITKYSPATRRYYIFDRNDFGRELSFSEAAPMLCGKLMTAGTHDGTVSFDTSMELSAKTGNVVFTGIQFQNDMNIRPLNDIRDLTVSPEQRSLSLYLSSLNYDDIRNVRYRYMLDGYDRHWNYVEDGRHAVNYSNLPAGDYTLRVQATDSNGTWSKDARTIEVHVTPLFTETVWFKMIILLLIAAAVAGMVYAIIYLSKVRKVLQHKYSLLMTVDELSPKVGKAQRMRPESDSDRIIKGTIEYLGANLAQSNILVDDIARSLGMSRTAYYTRIKEATGLPPSDFIRQFRIRHALKLLDRGDMGIAEVAFAVGFTDPKYFTKCFKAEMQMTPTQYVQSKAQKS